jgi:hypothetical protein
MLGVGVAVADTPNRHSCAHLLQRVQIGVLPVLTEICPLLKASPTAWLTHNILNATPKYSTAAQYSYAHTLLPTGPLSAALLGVVPI